MHLRHRFVQRRIELAPLRIDHVHLVLGEDRVKLPLHEFDTLQKARQVPAIVLVRVLDGTIQIIDRRKEILDEILVAVLDHVLPVLVGPTPEIVEIREKTDVFIPVFDQLAGHPLDFFAAELFGRRGLFGVLHVALFVDRFRSLSQGRLEFRIHGQGGLRFLGHGLPALGLAGIRFAVFVLGVRRSRHESPGNDLG